MAKYTPQFPEECDKERSRLTQALQFEIDQKGQAYWDLKKKAFGLQLSADTKLTRGQCSHEEWAALYDQSFDIDKEAQEREAKKNKAQQDLNNVPQMTCEEVYGMLNKMSNHGNDIASQPSSGWETTGGRSRGAQRRLERMRNESPKNNSLGRGQTVGEAMGINDSITPSAKNRSVRDGEISGVYSFAELPKSVQEALQEKARPFAAGQDSAGRYTIKGDYLGEAFGDDKGNMYLYPKDGGKHLKIVGEEGLDLRGMDQKSLNKLTDIKMQELREKGAVYDAIPSNSQAEGALPASAQDSDVIPSNAIPAEAIPAEAIPAEAIPAEALPAEALPAEAIPAEAIPAEAIPAEALPAEALPAEAIPAEAIPSNAIPSNAIPSNAIPSNAIPSNAIPSEALPAKALAQNLLRSAPMQMSNLVANLGSNAEKVDEAINDGSFVKQTGDMEVKQAENQVLGENENAGKAKTDSTITQQAAEHGKLSDYRKAAKARRRNKK